MTTEQLQEYATETPLLAAGTVPTAAPEILKESGIISGDLVSEDMFLLLEDKAELAKAFSQLKDPHTNIPIIRGYLQRKTGIADVKLVEKVSELMSHGVPYTDIVRAPSDTSSDAEIEETLLDILDKNKEKGVVFQRGFSGGGSGTHIISPKQIQDILKGEGSCTEELSKTFHGCSAAYQEWGNDMARIYTT